MSRILNATCENKTVKVEGQIVTATVLSQGTKASSGVAILDAGAINYVTSNASDISDLINSLGTIIDQIVTIVTTLDAGTTTPGTAASSITQLSSLKTQLSATKDNLK